MSRAQTLVLALLALHLLLGVLCLVIARGEHKSKSMRLWGLGLLAYAAGLLVTIAGGSLIPRPIALVVGNTLVTLSPVLCVAGVLAHTAYRLQPPWVVAGVLATVVALALSNFTGQYTLIVNIGAPTVLAVALFLVGAAAIANRGPRDARAACRFMAGIMIFAVATWGVRIGVIMGLEDGPDRADRLDLVVSLFAILQMINGVAATLSLVWIDVRLMQAELSRVAHTDMLTGLPNRRAVRMRFHEEMSRAARRGERFAMAIFDVDNFKAVNDRYGHAIGDEVLKSVATALGSAKRGEDVLGRIGGEEFLVLLAQQSLEGARDAAERLRWAVRNLPPLGGMDPSSVTVSGGVALYPEDGQSWDHLFAVADRRLYAAKRQGRDRVDVAA